MLFAIFQEQFVNCLMYEVSYVSYSCVAYMAEVGHQSGKDRPDINPYHIFSKSQSVLYPTWDLTKYDGRL